MHTPSPHFYLQRYPFFTHRKNRHTTERKVGYPLKKPL